MILLGYYALSLTANAVMWSALYLISRSGSRLDWLGRMIDDRDEHERDPATVIA